KSGYNLALHTFVKIHQIADHSVAVNFAADRDFQDVVVSMSVGIVALPVGRAVLSVRHLLAVQAMGCGETIATIQVGLQLQVSCGSKSKSISFLPFRTDCISRCA